MERTLGWFTFLLIAPACFAASLVGPDLFAGQPEADPPPVVVSDEFDGKLGLDWQIQNADESHMSLDKRPGMLTITTQRGGFHRGHITHKNLLLLENPVERGGDFEVTTCLVSFLPFASVQQAGLVCWNDEDNHVKWVFTWADHHGGRVFAILRETQGRPISSAHGRTMAPGERVWLRLTKRGNRYEYAASSDGESFRVFGEMEWDGEPPTWIGLVAKNSAGSGAPEIDASFDFFKVRELPAGELPVDPDIVPEGNTDDLLAYIKELKKFRPGATQAMLAAAQKILAQRPDNASGPLRTALSLVLENRVRGLYRANPQLQQQTVNYVKMFLKGMTEQGLLQQDVDIAMSTVLELEHVGQDTLAAQACEGFAEEIAQTDDEELAGTTKWFEAAARRFELVGNKLERLEGTTIDGKDFDWAAYQKKIVLIYFCSVPSSLCRAEIAAIREYYDVYHDRGFEVVEVISDGNRQALQDLLGKEQAPWAVLHDTDTDGMHPMAKHYGITAGPRAFLVDQAGRVVSIRARCGQLPGLLKDLLGPTYEHGTDLAMAGQWEELAANFEKVVKINPENGGAWHSLAIAYLQARDSDGFKKTCKRAFEQLSDSNIWAEAVLVQFCSLGPDAGVDRKELTKVVDAALDEENNTTMKLAKGMDDYRCGRFEEALNVLPKYGDSFQVPASLMFQAMAHKRLGHDDEAGQLLRRGIAEMEQRIPSIDGPPLADYMPARWVVWATHRVLRREAEEVIGEQGDEGN